MARPWDGRDPEFRGTRDARQPIPGGALVQVARWARLGAMVLAMAGTSGGLMVLPEDMGSSLDVIRGSLTAGG
jgi:hypothetical protein